MKALIFSVLALAFSMQAQATCAARDNSKMLTSATYDNQLPNSHSAQVQKPTARTQQPASTVRGRR